MKKLIVNCVTYRKRNGVFKRKGRLERKIIIRGRFGKNELGVNEARKYE